MRGIVGFRNSIKGSVTTVFAIALLPMIGGLGISVDYSRAMQARSVLQGAVDSTVLMLAREAPKKNQSELATMGNAYFAALMQKHPDIATAGVAVTKGDKQVSAAANATVPTYFSGIFGWSFWDLGVRTTSAYGGRKLEIALVLDNTGSMAASNKIGELKKASHSLLNLLQQNAQSADQVKVALVPYTTRVNLGTSFKNETWLTNSPTGTFMAGYNRPATRDAWQGCVADRDAPYNRAVSPVSIPVAQSLYPMVNCTDGVAKAQPLTSNWTSLHASVDAMQASGMTNITLGAQWGYEMLSGNAPFSQATGAGDVERFMILLTDGNNTQDRWGSWDEPRMNTDTQRMCDAIAERGVAESARTLKIKLYTILVIDGNETLLRNCASSPDLYTKVNQANQLDAVFKKIAEDIGRIRLTM